MELTRNQFDILTALCQKDSAPLTQRHLKELTGLSLGTINKTVQELTKSGLTENGAITQKGLQALEPYRAKRAIFLAAGFGTRLVPVTLNTPKPLVRVNGVRIIDTLIDACLKADISEIYIVRGYLAQQFDQLLDKYPMIRFIENPMYDKANNIGSALLVKDLLSNAYVLEADLLLSNPDVIQPYQSESNYLGIKREQTDDWCCELKDGYISEEKIGGTNCFQMIGISYWTAEDGAKLAQDLPKAFEMEGGKDLYWEQVPLKVFQDRYKVAVRECGADDITEIDTFNELKAIDKSYDV